MAEGWTSSVLCRYFMHGTCRNGMGCSYSHDPNLARPTLPCKFFQCGTCAYGSKCQYLHEEPTAGGQMAGAVQKAAAADSGPRTPASDTGQPTRTGQAGRAGRGQTGRADQAGRGQTARAEQAGRGQTARAEQTGRGQTARAEQAGRGQTARVEQAGRGQPCRTDQAGRGQPGRVNQADQAGRGPTGRVQPGRTEQTGRAGQTEQTNSTSSSSVDSIRRPMKELKLCDMTTGARVPVNWADAPEFVPSSGRGPPPPAPEPRSYADVTLPAESRRDPNDLELIPLCPYAAVGECRYGEHCALLHGDVCEYCQCQVLHPHDPEQQQRHRAECLSTHEQDMEHSFRMANSVDKACGICMEVVVEKKELSARRFGILPRCSHCFCVACIRQWRSSSQFESKVTRGCPECRVHSDFICPSRYWVDESEEKTKLIDDYITSCNNKPCKHFNEGRGECPFGNKCFYRHTYPDGRKAELGPPRRRRRQNQFIETELMSDVMLSDFLADEMRAMDEEDAEEAIRLNLMIIQADNLMDMMFPSDSDDE